LITSDSYSTTCTFNVGTTQCIWVHHRPKVPTAQLRQHCRRREATVLLQYLHICVAAPFCLSKAAAPSILQCREVSNVLVGNGEAVRGLHQPLQAVCMHRTICHLLVTLLTSSHPAAALSTAPGVAAAPWCAWSCFGWALGVRTMSAGILPKGTRCWNSELVLPVPQGLAAAHDGSRHGDWVRWRLAPPDIGCVRRPSSVRLCLRPPQSSLLG
jgi:hypothetical protein